MANFKHEQRVEFIQGEPVHDVDLENDSGAFLAQDDNLEAPLLPLAVDAVSNRGHAASTKVAAKDKGWATAFKLNVVVTLIAAVCFGKMALDAIASDSLSGAGRRRLQVRGDSEDDEESNLFAMVFQGALLIGTAGVVSAGVLLSLLHCSRGVLITAFVVSAGIWVVAALVLALKLSPFFIIPAVIFAIIFRAIKKRWHRIEFAAANLQVAALAIKAMPSTIWSAVAMSMVQLVWCLIAGIAAVGSFVALETVTAPDGASYRAIDCFGGAFAESGGSDPATPGDSVCMCNGNKISDEACNFSGYGIPLMFVWLMSMSWGCIVIGNVVACTVNGSVASWWFTPNEDPSPVKGAFKRSTQSSFGSLVKASVVQRVMAIVHMIANQLLSFVPCASFLLSWADSAVRYILAYAVCFIGVYGLSFNESGRRVHELFKRRALTTIANDVVVDFGLRLLTFSASFIYVFVALTVFIASISHGDNEDVDMVEVVSSLICLLFGWVACLLFVKTSLEVFRSGFKTVFVCFVQDPEVLLQKHDPQVHHGLNAAWVNMQAASGPTAVETLSPQGYARVRVN
eukprot:jgi/Undpi1/555/HiC_scaffold_10.g04019.m1